LVERFDTASEGGRIHMLSANALLKDSETQQDAQHPRYDDLADVIRHHGASPAPDLQRLYAQMLFNEAINNRDDHLRNFSFLQSLDGLTLSPAYDLVPTQSLGAWPVLSFNLEPGLPRPGTKAALSAAKAFGLPAGEARETNDRLTQALAQTHKLMDQCELATKDQELLTRLLWTP
jgi:serine/threonine-protein kinase HipA